jgi:O-antigen/teichoic acid export membrane protein
MTDSKITAPAGAPAISRNVIWNLAGEAAPMLAAVACMPLLIHGLGINRFGILSLAWALVGYLGALDIGLGRALTKLAADKLATGRDEEVPGLFWMAMVLLLAASLVGTAAMAAASPWLIYRALRIPDALRGEALDAFYILALSLPLAITTSAFRGVLAAFHRFDLLNSVRIPLGVAMFVSPLLVLPFSQSLVPAVAALIVIRLVGWFAYLFVCVQGVPGLCRYTGLRLQFVHPLLSFGGWITVSSVVVPTMLYGDRFLITVMLSTAAVAYYAAPCDIVLKLSVLPTAVAGVLFPVFANSFADPTLDRAASLIRRGTNLILVAMFPAALLIVTLAPEGLALWLGHDFSVHSAFVMRWLAVGILINALGGHLPFVLVQAGNRPDIIAKINVIEVPLYFSLLYWLVRQMGLEGAAIAWSLRLAAEAVAFWLAAQKLLPQARRVAAYTLKMLVAALSVVALGAMVPDDIFLKSLFLALSLSGYALVAWLFLLAPEDRQRISLGLRSVYHLPA